MKKIVVFIAGILMVAAMASASSIVGTKHDLSTVGTGTNTEVCVFCHTPHGADTSVTIAPLWNRTPVSAAGAVYNGVALSAGVVTDMTIVAINATDAPLCLSCHENSAALQSSLRNQPYGGERNLTAVTLPASATLSTDMSNDHPVAFRFSSVADTEIYTRAEITTNMGQDAFNYGSGEDMWCSSCHDVHSNSYAPFLRKSNAQSALCLACHKK